MLQIWQIISKLDTKNFEAKENGGASKTKEFKIGIKQATKLNLANHITPTLKEEKQEQVDFPSDKIGNHKVMVYFFNEFCDVVKVMIIHKMI
jgi:hypothetical protein